MTAILFLLEISNQNLLLGFVPESLGLLLFGVGLIMLTLILRRIFNRLERAADKKRVEAEQ